MSSNNGVDLAAERRRQEILENRLPPHLQQPASTKVLQEREHRRWENEELKRQLLESKLRRERELFRRSLKEKMIERSQTQKALKTRANQQFFRRGNERSVTEERRQQEDDSHKAAGRKLLEKTAFTEWSWSPHTVSQQVWGARLGRIAPVCAFRRGVNSMHEPVPLHSRARCTRLLADSNASLRV